VWTVRLADAAVTVSPRGNLLEVDAHDVAVVDQRATPAGETPAMVSLQMTWKGGGGRRRLAATAPAFAGRFFRRARARGTFRGAEDGFAFASDPLKPVRSTFAELGTERNGRFLAAAIQCARCGRP